MSKINPEVFRTYDVRGEYPTEINEDVAYATGRAVVRFLKAKKIAIGRDMRLSSPKLLRAAVRGIIDEGAEARVFGQAGIEMVYFVCGYYKMDGGIMITASHNGKQFNGMKLIRENAKSLTTGTGIDKVRDMAVKSPWGKEKEKTKGKEIAIDPWRDYKNYIQGLIDVIKFKPLKVVFDAESGMGGQMIEDILKDSPIELIKLNFKPDGNFPKHDPNPLIPENRKELEEKIAEVKADVGFSPDGDADRMVVVDENGELLMSDFVGALVADILLKEDNNKKVVWDLRRGWAIKDVTHKYGGKFYQTRAGYPFVKLKMREIDAVFGGETAAHYFYKDFFTSDSGVLTVLHILELMSKENKALSEIVKPYREHYFMKEERNFLVPEFKKLLKSVENYYMKKGAKISHLDCLSVDFDNWHFNFRPSNNPEPVYRLNLEAKDPKTLEKEDKELIKIISENSGTPVE